MRLLVVSSPERLAAAPEIPTLVEKGLPFVLRLARRLRRRQHAQPVIALLNREIGAVVQSADYRAMSDKAGTVALSSTPEELAKILAETYE